MVGGGLKKVVDSRSGSIRVRPWLPVRIAGLQGKCPAGIKIKKSLLPAAGLKAPKRLDWRFQCILVLKPVFFSYKIY